MYKVPEKLIFICIVARQYKDKTEILSCKSSKRRDLNLTKASSAVNFVGSP
jgi:hypothetical protein